MYPDHYGVSCTGHPIADIPEERNETNAIGVRLAALRRLKAEIGLQKLTVSDINYITRLYYMCSADGKWGEHHIIYILIVQVPFKKMKPNPGEISEFSLIPKGEMAEHLPTLKAPLTPFFNQIAKHRLPLWWNNLDDLSQVVDHDKIAAVEGCT